MKGEPFPVAGKPLLPAVNKGLFPRLPNASNNEECKGWFRYSRWRALFGRQSPNKERMKDEPFPVAGKPLLPAVNKGLFPRSLFSYQ
jgi:hypothetical protein